MMYLSRQGLIRAESFLPRLKGRRYYLFFLGCENDTANEGKMLICGERSDKQGPNVLESIKEEFRSVSKLPGGYMCHSSRGKCASAP